jgi:hypothetical protein
LLFSYFEQNHFRCYQYLLFTVQYYLHKPEFAVSFFLNATHKGTLHDEHVDFRKTFFGWKILLCRCWVSACSISPTIQSTYIAVVNM